MRRGRPREFDMDTALDAAMELFWTKGYEATSMQDVVDALGVHRASLYNAFGDKEALFLRVLGQYGRRYGGDPLRALQAEVEPRAALQAMFDTIVSRLTDPALPRGCLMANSALECSSGAAVIQRHVADGLAALEEALYQVLRRMERSGELWDGEDPRSLARFFLGVTQGMATVAKVTTDPTLIRDIAATAMRVLVTPA